MTELTELAVAGIETSCLGVVASCLGVVAGCHIYELAGLELAGLRLEPGPAAADPNPGFGSAGVQQLDPVLVVDFAPPSLFLNTFHGSTVTSQPTLPLILVT
jgi:hypothetical protein